MEKMKAYVFKDVGNLVFEEKPIPHVKEPDDVLLKVKAVGICGSDLKIIEGKHHFRPDTVLGHEFCGEVIEVGSHVEHVKLGDRVAIDNNIRCGFCSFCRMGLTSQCVEIKTSALGVMRDGGYAEYCLVPEKQCFVLPDEIDDILGTQVETLATVVNGMNTLLMLPYDYVMILGFGPIAPVCPVCQKHRCQGGSDRDRPLPYQRGEGMRSDGLGPERGGCGPKDHRFHLRT
jgi:threonine dehydrogenase-like Zn-dependent dehydrogenase